MRFSLQKNRRWSLEELVAGCACESFQDDSEPGAEERSDDNLIPWEGVLVIEGEPTGDGRMIEEGALEWSTPLPLRWVREDEGEHLGAIRVGHIETAERVGDEIRGTGFLYLDVPETAGLLALLDDTPMGISVDLDAIDFEIRIDRELFEEGIPGAEEDGLQPGETDDEGREIVIAVANGEELFVVTHGRIRGATLGDIPAFDRAQIQLAGDAPEVASSEAEAATVAASMIALLPEDDAPFGLEFADIPHVTLAFLGDGSDFPDGAESAAEAAAQHAPIEARVAGVGFLGDQDPPATVLFLNGDSIGDAREAAQVDGAPEQLEPFIAHMTVGYGVPLDEVTHLVGETFVLDRAALVGGEDEILAQFPAQAETIAASALQVPTRPPKAWFADPKLDRPTRLTATDDGRVYGHVALWNSCHTGFADRCVPPPRSRLSYQPFLQGVVRTKDGGDLATGPVVVGTTHADRKLTAHATAAWYEDTGAVIADVTVGEDKFGVWASGALRPTVTEAQLREFNGAPPSGDWRPIRGGLELVGILGVNVPGFPVVASAHVEDGEIKSLITGWDPRDGEDVVEETYDPRTDVVLQQMAQAERARRRRHARAVALRVADAKVAAARR